MKNTLFLLAILLFGGCQKKEADCIPQVITFTPSGPFCTFSNVPCKATVSVPFLLTEACNPAEVTLRINLDVDNNGTRDELLDNATVLSGTFPNFTLSGDFPIGQHAFIVDVSDCGCQPVTAIIPFTVADCKPPAPICINGIAIELMPTAPGTDADGDGDIDAGALTIQATDFLASAITDCSSPITYSINLPGAMPDKSKTSLVLTCDNAPTTLVEIYAWDSANNPSAVQPNGTKGGPNYDYCQTYILVQQNQVTCN